ncbi:MAG: MFS transporter [Anaerolineales bacterium]
MKISPRYRWYLLGLSALTVAVVIGIPSMSLSVLFNEISSELQLNLVQVGWVWSIGALPALFTGFFCGGVIDRFGPKRVMIIGIASVSLATAARGLAGNFLSLIMIILVVGTLVPLVSMSGFKISGILFPHRQLGLANGILSMGMAFGLLFGSLFSASVFSPLLGGWRNVMFFYGALALMLCLPWFFVRLNPEHTREESEAVESVPIRQALGHVIKLKNIWLLGIAFLGLGGCVQGISGYLPMYLRGIGWPGTAADGALSIFNAMSLIFILPLAYLSDRLGSRKTILLGALAVLAAGTVLLAAADGWAVWAAVALSGMMRDGSAALILTMAVETEGVGPRYAGSATGLAMTFFFLGNLISPPIGNKLAEIAPGAPFLFWAGMAQLGIVSLLFVRSGSHMTPKQVFPPAV